MWNCEELQLPDETLITIFSYLPIRAKLQVERVCKRWQTLVQHSKGFPFVTLNLIKPNSESFFDNTHESFADALSESGESQEEAYCQTFRTKVKQACKFLTQYVFVGRVLLSSDNLFHLLFCLDELNERERKLEDLQVELHQTCKGCFLEEAIFLEHGSSITKQILHSHQSLHNIGLFSNLRELNVGFKVELTRQLVLQLPESITSLWMTETGVQDFDEGAFDLLTQKYFSRLKRFCARTITVRQLERLATNCCALTTLSLEVDELPIAASLSCLSKLVQLEHLRIGVDEYDFQSDYSSTLEFLKALPKLKTLELGEIFETPKTIDVLIKHCHNIRDLNLDYWSDLQVPIPLYRLNRLPRLTTIRFTLSENRSECAWYVKLVSLSNSLRNKRLTVGGENLRGHVTQIADTLNERARENKTAKFIFALENNTDRFICVPSRELAKNMKVLYL